ncbi:MAG TPA: ATP synthase subunit I [Pyrinomonadaceae bacterium]|nr:ATP synthase subunit I [Pyrinomonadaceae bacterium]
MGEETQLSQGPQNHAEISHRRILFEMAVIIVVAAAIGAVFGSAKFAVGVFIGGLLAFGNYFWLRKSTGSLFERVASGGTSGWPAVGFLLRYIAIGLVLLGIYFSNVLPIAAVILGLASFALAVVVDGTISIFRSSFKKEI